MPGSIIETFKPVEEFIEIIYKRIPLKKNHKK